MITIKDVQVDDNHADIKGKSVSELKKLNLFEHLPEGEQEDAYQELYDAVNGKTETRQAYVSPANED